MGGMSKVREFLNNLARAFFLTRTVNAFSSDVIKKRRKI